MRDLPSSAQSAIEYGVVVILIVIIIAGSYKLYKNWTSPEPVKTHQSSTANIGQKIMEKPSKEFCTYVMKQCSAKYDMK